MLIFDSDLGGGRLVFVHYTLSYYCEHLYKKNQYPLMYKEVMDRTQKNTQKSSRIALITHHPPTRVFYSLFNMFYQKYKT
jgi:hypothetical protein